MAPDRHAWHAQPRCRGRLFSLLGSFTDPGDDTWTATVNYGDGTGDQPLSLAANHTFDLGHFYQSAGSYGVKVTVTDDDGGVGTASVTEVVGHSGNVADRGCCIGHVWRHDEALGDVARRRRPASGKTLSFSINGQSVGSAQTDASGIATLTGVSSSALHAGTATISVSFAEDTLDVANTSDSPLSIGKAPLMITADGQDDGLRWGLADADGQLRGLGQR